jgi:hypothetical protein
MTDPEVRRLRRSAARDRTLPSDRDWERSVVLEPRPAARLPELISDGGGLPFAPAALAAPCGRLDPADPAVGALLVQLARQAAPRRTSRLPWRRTDEPAAAPATLDSWRLLARTEDQALFGRGTPPRLVTLAVQRDARRGTWAFVAQSAARPLRATRDAIRASSWRLDPSREINPEQIVRADPAH